MATLVFWGGVAAALLTGAYITRAFLMTFHGEYRGGASEQQVDTLHRGGLHESPWIMIGPIVVLSVLAVVAWVANAPGIHLITDLLHPLGAEVESFHARVAAIALTAGLAGVASAVLFRRMRGNTSPLARNPFTPVVTLLTRKYYVDELYEDVLVRRVMHRGIWRALAWFDSDRGVVDRTVNTVGLVGRNVGRVVAKAQSGQLQTYAAVLSVGVVIIFAAYVAWGGGLAEP